LFHYLSFGEESQIVYNRPMYFPISQPVWIDSSSALKHLADTLCSQSRIAVDTEANSLHAYRERVCLIQFSTVDGDYLVDPLALDDLTYLAPIFADPNIEKIFHAAEYDVLGLHRDFDFVFSNLFDTMIAARTLGYTAVGLGSLLAEKFGLDLNKHHQKADWGQRPLSESQIEYARLDTHYLIALRDILENELREKDRWGLAYEDFVRSCYINGNGQREPRERWERVGGQGELDLRQQTILNELCLSREKIAERLNRPVFKVVNDHVLLEAAKNPPQSLEDLAALGMTEKQIQRCGKAMLDAVQRGSSISMVEPTRVVRPPNAVLNRQQLLKNWRKNKGKELQVESDVVLPRPYLYAIAEKNPRSHDALAQVMDEAPWRLEHFGPEILKVLGIK
jgi:ribonuclease D